MRVFSDARIDYGRIDYCLTERGLEVFEINTNPAVLSNPPTRFDRFDYVPWASRHADALLELDHVTTEENIALPGERAIRTTHESVVARLSRKLARRRARATARLAARRGTFAIATGLKGIVRNLRAPH